MVHGRGSEMSRRIGEASLFFFFFLFGIGPFFLPVHLFCHPYMVLLLVPNDYRILFPLLFFFFCSCPINPTNVILRRLYSYIYVLSL